MSPISAFDPDDMSDWFWDIIQRADRERTRLQTIMQSPTIDGLYRFALAFMHAADNVRQEPYTQYCDGSEDDIADMSYWAVSQGKAFYAAVRDHPEAMSAYDATDVADAAGSDSFEFVAEGVLYDRLGQWPDDIVEKYGAFLSSGYARIGDYWAVRRVREQ